MPTTTIFDRREDCTQITLETKGSYGGKEEEREMEGRERDDTEPIIYVHEKNKNWYFSPKAIIWKIQTLFPYFLFLSFHRMSVMPERFERILEHTTRDLFFYVKTSEKTKNALPFDCPPVYDHQEGSA